MLDCEQLREYNKAAYALARVRDRIFRLRVVIEGDAGRPPQPDESYVLEEGDEAVVQVEMQRTREHEALENLLPIPAARCRANGQWLVSSGGQAWARSRLLALLQEERELLRQAMACRGRLAEEMARILPEEEG